MQIHFANREALNNRRALVTRRGRGIRGFPLKAQRITKP